MWAHADPARSMGDVLAVEIVSNLTCAAIKWTKTAQAMFYFCVFGIIVRCPSPREVLTPHIDPVSWDFYAAPPCGNA